MLKHSPFSASSVPDPRGRQLKERRRRRGARRVRQRRRRVAERGEGGERGGVLRVGRHAGERADALDEVGLEEREPRHALGVRVEVRRHVVVVRKLVHVLGEVVHVEERAARALERLLAGARSTTFWLRLCTEQSRSYK